MTYEEDGIDGSIGGNGAVERLGVCKGVSEGDA